MSDLFWTSKEAIALDLILDWLGESRFNQTPAKYIEIASRLPKLEAAFAYVNGMLAKTKANNRAPYEICYFRAGDLDYSCKPYPSSLSRETVRRALKKYRDQAHRLRWLLNH